HEHGVMAGLDHISLASVCAKAGYTTGAAYRCWDSQEEFRRELAISTLLWRDRPSTANMVTAIGPQLKAGAPLLEVIRVAAEANVTRTPEDTDFFVLLALRASAFRDQALMKASAQRVEDGLVAHDELFQRLLRAYRRRPRAPYTVRHLSATLGALAEGFAVQDCTHGEHLAIRRTDLDPAIGTEWSLFGVAAQFLVEAFTEPTDADPGMPGTPPPQQAKGG
ncbi:MAG: hypothetical protein ACRCYQ_04220, partial [Nocardioides sp.]